MTDDPFILASDPEALKREGIPMHPATAIRQAKEGNFPNPVRLAPHKQGWFSSALRDWLEMKKSAA